jgi:hypothetical protein
MSTISISLEENLDQTASLREGLAGLSESFEDDVRMLGAVDDDDEEDEDDDDEDWDDDDEEAFDDEEDSFDDDEDFDDDDDDDLDDDDDE